MRFLLSAVLCLVAAITGRPAGAESHHETRFPIEIRQQLDGFFSLLLNDYFDSALAVVDSFPISDAVGPMAELCRATLFQAQMAATESDSLRPVFIDAVDRLKAAAERFLAERGDSALAWYYLGQAAALRAVVDGRAGHRWSALRQGLSAGKLYSRAYRLDRSFHDLAMGLGSYRYWKSVRTRLLNWTPFFEDEREDGLRLLSLAIDSSEISADAARAALLYALINERRYDEAVSLADSMHRKYPDGMTFLWGLGEAYFKMGDFPKAAEMYATILGRQMEHPGNYYNAVEAAYFLSECCRRSDGPDGRHCRHLESFREEIGRWPLPEETRRRQAKKLAAITGGGK
ncbi:MAG: tetratricopeptide repeat protein [candidate division Zixibacteria bacterium]|nr:tetratricopeptide repeat protein [candidate division Zixibacteria bacterium]